MRGKALRFVTPILVILPWACGCGENSRYRPSAFFDDGLVAELTRAAQAGDIQAIDACVGRGADVNAIGKHRATPLMLTFLAKNKTGYKHLLKLGADPDIQEELGRSVTILAASEKNDSEWLKDALIHGADPNNVNSQEAEERTPLLCAIRAGNLDSVQAIVEAGGSADIPTGNGEQPLVWAARNGHWDIVYFLLNEGADIRASVPGHVSGDGLSAAEYLAAMPRAVVAMTPEQIPAFDTVLSFLEAQGIAISDQSRNR